MVKIADESLIELEAAIVKALEYTVPVKRSEKVHIFDALNRVLAEDIACQKPLPPFDSSSVDGYAVKILDSAKTVQIVGSVFVGDNITDFELLSKEAVRIVAGAMLPDGAEAVVPFKSILESDEYSVKLPQEIAFGANIRKKGEEAKEGAKLLEKGEKLTAIKLSLLASQGISVVSVFKKPTIAVFSLVNELKEPWQNAQNYQIYNSSGIGVYAALKSFAADVSYVAVSCNSGEETKADIAALLDYDMLLSIGGESNFVESFFLELGLNIIFKNPNLQHGDSTIYGKIADTAILMLPDNSIPAILNCYIFGKPIVAKIAGERAVFLDTVTLRVKKEFSVIPEAVTVVLGIAEGGEFEACEENKYDFAAIKPIANSNAFIVSDKKSIFLKGETVLAVIFDGNLREYFCGFIVR